MKWQRRLRLIAAIVLLLLAAFFGYKLYSYWQEGRTADKNFSDLAEQFHPPLIVEPAELLPKPSESDEPERDLEAEALALVHSKMVESLMLLQEQNSDTFAWLYVEGTKIDYPVMYTPDSPEYYLRKDFSKNYSAIGTPFVDARCDFNSNNFIIYGHYNQTGLMFADLHKFQNEEYIKEHPTITLTLPSGVREYEVFATFLSAVHVARNEFPWFNYYEIEDETDFDEYISQMRSVALFPFPSEPEYGDRFVTLVTCAYQDSTGRMVVIGREISDSGAANTEND